VEWRIILHRARGDFLVEIGINVLRFSDGDVFEDIGGVMKWI